MRLCAGIAVALLVLSAPAVADSPGLEALRAATRSNPKDVQAWDRLGVALSRERRFAEARQAFDSALRLSPNDKGTLYHIALSYAWSGDYAMAARRYQALLEHHPDDHAIRLDYGQALAWARRYDAARQQYEIVLRGDPQHVEALRHLGLLTAWEGRYDDAIKYLRQADQIAVDNIHVQMALGEVLSWKGDLSAATRHYRKTIELNPENTEAILRLAGVLARQGIVRDALVLYERAINLEPMNLEGHLGFADLLIHNRQFAKAETALRHAQGLFPAEPRLGERLSALATERSWSLSSIAERIEIALFIIIPLVIYRHAWRYRRVLSQHRPYARALLYSLPLFSLIMLSIFLFTLIGVAPYQTMTRAYHFLELFGIATLGAVFFFLVWLLRFERPARRQTVLAIGAHPDDIEFGCGATLLRLREEGCATHGLVMSGGERGGGNDVDRVLESKSAASVLSMTDIEILAFPDTRLGEHVDALKAAIEKSIQAIQPDIIFTHTPNDVHSDHRAVFEATREAARGACTILCYENPNTPPSFNPTYFVDIGDYLNDKLVALGRHKSQSGKPYLDPAVIRNAAGFRGTQARIKYAEAYEVVRVLEKPLAE